MDELEQLRLDVAELREINGKFVRQMEEDEAKIEDLERYLAGAAKAFDKICVTMKLGPFTLDNEWSAAHEFDDLAKTAERLVREHDYYYEQYRALEDKRHQYENRTPEGQARISNLRWALQKSLCFNDCTCRRCNEARKALDENT